MTKTLYIFDQGLKGLVGHYYEYVRSIVEAAEAEGIRCVVGCHVDGGDGTFASFDFHPVFRDDVWGTIPGKDYNSATNMNGISARFIEDTSRILAEHPIKPGDIIFLPNVAKPHIVAAALIAEKFAPIGVLTHVMFRYPAAHFEGETAAQCFRRLEAVAASHDVSLCTDSHRLAANLGSLTHLPFVVFPIPHTWHKETKGELARDPKRPLHCVSLGNARDEKGMAEILEAVRLSAREPWGDQLRFTLQVNDPYQVEEQIEAFRRGPDDPRTTLVDRALSSEEYVTVLDSADVVLVPYWRSIYRERTSGVFLEGVITGKLVLCTRDTWMSDLLDLHNGGIAVDDRSGAAVCEGLRQLIERREELQQGADRAARYWQDIHCPKNLVAHLTGQTPRSVVHRHQGKKAAVLFPWGEAVSGKTGAATRLKYFIKYLESVYDEVRILFTGSGEPGGTIGRGSQAVPVHYSEKAKALHDQLRSLCRKLGIPEERCFHLWFHLWPCQDELFQLRCEELILWADEVYLEYTFFSEVVDGLCRQHGKPYILTLHDIVSDQSIETPFLHQATKALEFGGACKASRVVCSSEADRTKLATEGIVAELIPHPIDCQEAVEPFSREEARVILDDLYGLKVDGRRVCFFVGSFYPPNTEAAGKIAEMAERSLRDPKMRNVTFVVAGSCMQPGRKENFAALGMIEGAAISAIMACADIVLIPLQRGTGVSVKSIEALARGSLILSTSVGMRGLDVVDGVHCLIEDDLESYPARIAEMLSNGETAQRMRAAARKFGEQFDYRRLMALYVPGIEPKSSLAETMEEFSARREAAIRELLPRLEKTKYVSPLLRDLLKNMEAGAVSKPGADPSLRPERDMLQSANPDLERRDLAIAADDAESADAVDPDWYLAAYPDVAILGMDPQEHYAWIGRELGRKPNGGSEKKKLIFSPT
jgi:glycosyltransferase involved in cell wall biosynthesis